MALFERFDGWMADDFAAWAPAKRASNRFTPERSRVRERLRSLVEVALERQGLDRAGLELWSAKAEPHFFNDHSVDHAAALLTRPSADRDRIEAGHSAVSAANPERYHAHIAVRADGDGVVIELGAPELAAFDLQGARQAAAGWADWVELLGWSLPPVEAAGVVVARRWSVDEALAWTDPIGDLGMWLSQALPALRTLLAASGAAAPAVEAPATSAEGTDRQPPPARVQAAARPWQPYRPQAPAPPRKLPTEPRPSLVDRIVPFLQPPPEPPPPPRQQWHGDRDRPGWREDRGGPPQQQGHPSDRRQQQPPGRNDRRPEDARWGPPREPQPPTREPPKPPPPHGPSAGDKVVLTGGLLAGKEGEVVANLGRTVKVRVGKLEFELPLHQLQPA